MATTKQCPGARLAKAQLTPAHDAKLDQFASNKANKDGLARVCRVCWKVYEAARKATKGGTVSPLRAEGPVGGTITPTTNAKPQRAGVVYHDNLAAQAAGGKAKGYTTEVIDGVTYALPTDNGAVGSAEGQVALEEVNKAKADERRKRDAQRKRDERAAAKAAKAEAATA